MIKVHLYWLISIVVIILFFIIFIIYTAFFHTKISNELVSNHYYEEEIEFQEIIDEKNNADYFTNFKIQVVPLGIKFFVLNGKKISGTLNLLRHSNVSYDVARVIHLDITGKKIIPASFLKDGTYLLKVRYKDYKKRCFVEKSIKWKI